MIPALEDRREKRDPLNVIPMGMRKEDVSLDRSPVRPLDQRAPEFADPGPRVENDQPAAGRPHLHARRVAAVAQGEGAWAWDRASRAPKLHPQAHLVSLDTRHDSTSGLRLERRVVTSVM